MKTFAALLSLVAMAIAAPQAAKADDGWIVKESPHSVSVTADKLVAAIGKAGATLFARVDHAAGAKKAGLELDDATLVIFGNPKLGTPIMKANPKAGLDLPIRVLIWSQDGKTMIGGLSPDTLKARYTLKGADGPLGKMNGAMNNLMGAAIK